MVFNSFFNHFYPTFTEMVEEHTKNKANQSKESKEAMMFLKQKMDVDLYYTPTGIHNLFSFL